MIRYRAMTETRYIPPEDRRVLDELPRTNSRGAPKVWESRLRELIGTQGWHELAQGERTSMQAMKSNFRYGRMSVPAGEIFDCEVVPFDDPERDHEAACFFRWVRTETDEDRQEAAKRMLQEKLKKLETEINQKAEVLNDAPVDTPEERVAVPASCSDPAAGDVLDSSLADLDDDGDTEHHEVDQVSPLTPEQLADITARIIPVEDEPLDEMFGEITAERISTGDIEEATPTAEDMKFDSGLDDL